MSMVNESNIMGVGGGGIARMMLTGENQNTSKKPFPLPLYPLQIQHRLGSG
jgi:hypothetical protein